MTRAPSDPRPNKPRRGATRRGERMAPLYRQVYAILREEIVSGALDPADSLPSEPALAARFAVSRITIRKTLEHLERDRLVRRVRGVGTFPTPRGGEPARTNISGELDNLISFDGSTTAETLFWETVTPDGAALAALGPAPCLRIVRLRSHQGQPIAFTTLHVPAAYTEGLEREACADMPIIRAIEQNGILAQRSEQAITAVAAAAEVAARLGVAEGSPLILMRRLMLTGDNAPVLHQESLYAPERFEYRMTLTRTSVGSAARWTAIA